MSVSIDLHALKERKCTVGIPTRSADADRRLSMPAGEEGVGWLLCLGCMKRVGVMVSMTLR